MKKLLLLSSMSLFIIIFAGCADCENESDYDYVGVTQNDFAARSQIKISNTQDVQKCSQTTNYNGCTVNLTNPNKYGNINQGFTIQCSVGYVFNLQETIHTLFPQEAYKDDRFESCEDYYVYDFFANTHRSEIGLEIQSVNVDETDPNKWYVNVGGICYDWNVTDTQYAITK